MRTIKLAAAVVLGTFAIMPCEALATTNSHLESFSTTMYMDPYNTSAIWDTGAGELRARPFALGPIATTDTPDNAWIAFASGSRAYVADQSSLLIYEISEASAPAFLGSLALAPGVCDVHVVGTWAFVANSAAGLQVVDVSAPWAPALVATVPAGGPPRGVFVSGRLAFVAADAAGLLIFDVANPAAPLPLGVYDTPGSAWAVHVEGLRAFVADRAGGLQVIDVSSPAIPVLLGSFATGGSANGIFVSGRRAFVADVTAGIFVLDVSQDVPVQIGHHPAIDAPFDIVALEDRLLAVDGSSLLEFNLADPSAPALVSTWMSPGAAQGLSVWGQHLLVADGAAGFHVVRLAHHVVPAVAGTLPGSNPALELVLSGSAAYLATWSGLVILDVSTPRIPVPLGISPLEGARCVKVAGNQAFVGTYDGQFHILDIRDPGNPTPVGTLFVPPNPVNGVGVESDRAYLASGDEFRVVDISEPSAPVVMGSMVAGWAWDFALSGRYAYLAGMELRVIDIGDAAAPVVIGSIALPPSPTAIELSGTLAIVLCQDVLQLADVTDPFAPVLLGSAPVAPSSHGLAVAGNRAYVAGPTGLLVFDISVPTAPALVATGATSISYNQRLCVVGGHVYVAWDHRFETMTIAQHVADGARNRVQSTSLTSMGHVKTRGRLSAVQSSGVLWELSADHGSRWQAAISGGGWVRLTPGEGVVWRCTLEGADVLPRVDQLLIEWLYEFPLVSAVADIPRDQGRQVRLRWLRSGYDFADESDRIVEYAVYRKIDPGLGKAVAPDFSALDGGASEALRQHAQGMAEIGWDFITRVPVRMQDGYSVVVPTLEDSTASGPYHSVFMVSALTATPGLFFDSPPDSGQSADNLAPGVPSGFTVAYGFGTDGNRLAWEESPEADLQYYRIYRGSTPGFQPSTTDLVHLTAALGWTDSQPQGTPAYYKLSAVDFAGNEGPAAAPQTITGVEDLRAPGRFVLHGNAPNPFNPTTVIRYDVPAGGGAMSLRIYDLGGRLVRTLIDGRQEAGSRTVVWDGRDAGAKAVASGTYLLRLVAPGITQARKLTLAR